MQVNFDPDVRDDYRDVLEAASHYFLKKLVPAPKRKGINLSIDVIDNFEYLGLHVNEDMFDENGEIDMIPDNPRNFSITLRNSDNICDLVKTLAHELVHTKQHIMGEMNYAISTKTEIASGQPPIVTTWMGTPWFPKRGDILEFDAPWEREAYSLENSLYFKFQRYWNRNYK